MNPLRCAVLALSLCTVVAAAAQDPSRFESVAARFSLTKPAGWRFVNTEGGLMTAEEWAQVDGELRKKVDPRRVPRSLVTMVSHRSPDEAVSVLVIPLSPGVAKESATQILTGTLAQVKKVLADVTIEVPIRKREISGRPAAEYVATYTIPLKDGPARARATSIVVPRGNVVFLIGLVAPVESGERVNADFAKIVDSITVGD